MSELSQPNRKGPDESHSSDRAAAGQSAQTSNALFDDGMEALGNGGKPPDYAKAFQCFSQATAAGHHGAQAVLAALYMDGLGVSKDPFMGVRLALASAEHGNPTAQSLLGRAYLIGEGTKRDYSKAAYWLAKAVENGRPEALANLAALYDAGQGVTQSREYAISLFERLLHLDPANGIEQVKFFAAGGNLSAKCVLGALLAGGIGVKQDREEGIKLLNEASSAGIESAKKLLGITYVHCQDQKQRGVEMLREYAATDHAAALQVGIALEKDHSMEAHAGEALEFLWQAERNGNPRAALILGVRAILGEYGVEQNLERAFDLITRASEGGDAFASNLLAIYLLGGLGVSQDVHRAFALFEKEAEGGNVMCRFNLALLRASFGPGAEHYEQSMEIIHSLESHPSLGTAARNFLKGSATERKNPVPVVLFPIEVVPGGRARDAWDFNRRLNEQLYKSYPELKEPIHAAHVPRTADLPP